MTLRPRDRIALGVILLLGIVAGYYLLALQPEQNKATALSAAIASERQTLTQAQQSYAAGRAAQASLKADATQWASLGVAVPAQSDIPALLRTLERTAKAAHVKMQAITLAGATGSAPTTSSSAPASTSGATSVPVSLTFAGGYTALNSLVQRLDRLVVVAGGKVHATGPLLSINDVSLSGAPKLIVQLSATIYQLNAASTSAAVPTGGH
jgi:Tfp pilus assembly protein PilO